MPAIRVRAAVLCAALALAVPALVMAQEVNPNALDQILGRHGQRIGEVYKFGFPRSDLHVVLRGVAVRPGLALGSWAAFQGGQGGAEVMGDLCLLPSEVNPVMARLRAGGYEISALHNHLLFEAPHVMFLHYMGHGSAEDLARTLRAALALSGTPMTAPAPARAEAAPAWAGVVESALGHSGTWKGGVLAVGIPRAEPVTIGGAPIPPAMGVAESLNFQAAGGGKVATTGDFVLTASEVNPVISALEQAHITITALHSHMLSEQPRLFYMHFWAVAPPRAVALGLRTALARIRTR